MKIGDSVSSFRGLVFGSGQLPRNNINLALSCAALVLVLCSAGPAWSVSGEVEAAQGVYEIPQAQCNALARNLGLPAGFDVLFTCDADRNGCRLTSDGLDEGLALGFCANKFDLNPYQYEGPIEENVVIEATSFGNDIGVLRPPFVGEDGIGVDILCETFVQGTIPKKVCRKIIEGGPPGGPSCPTNSFIPTKRSDCVAVKQLLASRVTGDPNPNISFGLFIDVDKAGRPGSEALFVCPGFKWECADPADPNENGVKVQYQFTKFIIDTPGCIKIGGTCYRYRP